ncbi:hypothetical protein EV421DRAFT_1729908 [Armillaria borealis]|uniref:Uncharacterized protein n=1 Tax=Armillaria borealis TaxID=47425 RepID=A0AA39K566_9AGAR|nr:hypothetical protein EV421DRAFT_1729908 [Armillaria borealis]
MGVRHYVLFTLRHIQLSENGQETGNKLRRMRYMAGILPLTKIKTEDGRSTWKYGNAPERNEILCLIRIETASSNAGVNFLTLLPVNTFHPSGSSMVSMCHPSIQFPLNPLKDFPSFRHGSAGQATPSSIMPALPRDDVTHSGPLRRRSRQEVLCWIVLSLASDRPSDSFSIHRLNGPAFLYQVKSDSRHMRSTGGEEDPYNLASMNTFRTCVHPPFNLHALSLLVPALKLKPSLLMFIYRGGTQTEGEAEMSKSALSGWPSGSSCHAEQRGKGFWASFRSGNRYDAAGTPLDNQHLGN